MTVIKEFCIVRTDYCLTMQEWGVWWQAIGVLAAVVFGVAGLIKIIHELKRINEQREKEQVEKIITANLNRTKFFLEQHRRLFDNADLYEVTCLLDSDSILLSHEAMWDRKRKFLTFIEEISLLVRSEQIDSDVAYYMFGYYAYCAFEGVNFRNGIEPSAEHWGLFYEFVNGYVLYLERNPAGPPITLKL
ncbi:hypothetical protein M2R28_06835 [Aeromonas hydrophila]|uniref:hypothetical protein n=1 Tax=Aeromonas hydrophila TaxID=644 RepID=UPI001F4C062E|nr:hypothetical protein [Aeromonas hydrophila]MCO4199404.1 hypothetical protein [Aeromonas hydrophila]UNB60423.1 hypothetical protein MKW86_10200 [Aeromonas hydrophila]